MFITEYIRDWIEDTGDETSHDIMALIFAQKVPLFKN